MSATSLVLSAPALIHMAKGDSPPNIVVDFVRSDSAFELVCVQIIG